MIYLSLNLSQYAIRVYGAFKTLNQPNAKLFVKENVGYV